MITFMGKIRCEDVLARLWEFIDGELAHDERDAVRQHLEVCRRCYPQYDFQRAYLRYVRGVAGNEQASPQCRRQLFQALLEQERRGLEGS